MDIQLRNIHKRFGSIHANNDINVDFPQGRITGVLGENGAGKSTLMKILSGFQPADSGEILLDGAPAQFDSPEDAIHEGIGMLQQDPLDIGAFTTLENFVYGRDDNVLPDWGSARSELIQAAGNLGFNLEMETPVELLSIAMRQQLEIVRLLALGVRALILDEPTTGISAEQKTTLFEALQQLAHEDGVIVLLVSHKLEDVITLCDKVVVLRDGRLIGEEEMPQGEAAAAQLGSEVKSQLVRLMFGQELGPHVRKVVPLDKVVMQLENLQLRDRRLQIEGLNLSLRRGEVVGLAGLENSGQSLTMRAICGLGTVAAGRVLLENENMTHRSYRQFLGKGVVFGAAGRLEEGLIAGLTLTEHMALVRNESALLDWPALEQQTRASLGHYDVRGQAEDKIEQLSGGNQQRVLMALLPANPRLLILEQPTRGLDVESARWIWQQLLERREGGTAILFSSAELDELVAYSDRILVFYAGRVHEVKDVAATTIDELGYLIGGEFSQV